MFKKSIIIGFFSISFVLFGSFLSLINNNESRYTAPQKPAFLSVDTIWADSVLHSLSLEEKIGQLLMVKTSTKNKPERINELVNDIKKYNLGGVLFSQETPFKHAKLYNYLQSQAKTPLLTSMDAEWGISMRIDSILKFPRQMTLGAIKDDNLIFAVGEEIGKQCRQMGVHINFSPVLDVNVNPDNPVIGNRSFGENTSDIIKKGYAFMMGMQKQKIIATAKHFPGHGDTETDSHHELPIVPYDKERLDSIELKPFKELIRQGLGAVMIGHLDVPALSADSGMASTLSKKIVNNLLKETLGFEGLVITDAMAMKGIKRDSSQLLPEVAALVAGNDILLVPQDVEETINAIKQAISDSIISEEQITQKCRKILLAKSWVGLKNMKTLPTNNISKKINNEQAELLNRHLYENAITVLKNQQGNIPFYQLENKTIASVAIGAKEINVFQEYLRLYADVKPYAIYKDASQSIFDVLLEILGKFDVVIVSMHDIWNNPAKNFGLTPQSIDFVEQLANKTNVVLDFFGTPYGLTRMKGLDKCKSIVLSYEDNDIAQEISAQVIFGGLGAKGILPVSLSSEYPVGKGIQTNQIRFEYSTPADAGMDNTVLAQIDSIAQEAIEKEAAPGCQILAAKNGKVFFYKAYGYHTYEKEKAVKRTDIYDIASITKIAATLPSLMKLRDEKKFKVRSKLSKYIDGLDTTNKKNVSCKEALAHYAKLPGWYPFYVYSLADRRSKTLNPELYATSPSDSFPLQVAENMYISESFKDSVYKMINELDLKKKKKYKYSDIAFYLFQEVVENLSHTSIDDYTHKHFYAPLGAYTLGYNPLNRFDRSIIVPTEDDQIFRKQLIHGYVHDSGAAILGGVAGHAGLFSNANDLAKLMQMYLQNGQYGGRYYINKETLEFFEKRPYRAKKNRRALGFDKPTPDGNDNVANSKMASDESFGHTGFTGTIAWVDPSCELVYIFLSNRVHPDMKNNKINELNIRSRIHDVFYDAIIKDNNVHAGN